MGKILRRTLAVPKPHEPSNLTAEDGMKRSKMIVHGGAWDIPVEQEADHLSAVRRAIGEVFPLLQLGLSALDAVERAVCLLEDDPAVNAGRGAVLNLYGEIELDAMIMDGRLLRAGAVGAVSGILHPVTLARAVMERTEHCLLVGHGAVEFAQSIGMPKAEPTDLLTERELAYYRQNVRDNPAFNLRQVFRNTPADTVGVVAMDEMGDLAAATSTGGTPGKLRGRVGDSPIIGAGGYADCERGAASATGRGEDIMRVLLSKTACELMADAPAQTAAKKALAELTRRVQGLAGLIVIDHNGGYGWAHSTPKMAVAYAEPDGTIRSYLVHP
jgi:L-asparaginase / beta-aspartyl-peptidase